MASTAGGGDWTYPSVPDTGYNSVPLKDLPFEDYSLPLGDHLTLATKERIWKGNYVHIFGLLNRKVNIKAMNKDDEVEKERCRCHEPDKTRANWLTGFLIYTGVIVKAQPWRAQSLFQYLDPIYRAYMDFPVHTWLIYEENFCLWAVTYPNLRWDEPHPRL